MNLQQFTQFLAENPTCNLLIRLPSGQTVAEHFHITEVGKVTKDFVDCGGVRRSDVACALQTLVANDVDHRLLSDKLLKILGLAEPLALDAEVPVEFEIQGDSVQVFALDQCQVEGSRLIMQLAAKQTACLAPDKCGIGPAESTEQPTSCSGSTGCC